MFIKYTYIFMKLLFFCTLVFLLLLVTTQEGTTQKVSCNHTQFPCQSGDQCVPLSAHCDNNYDCRDYSDEENCGNYTCCLYKYK